MVKYFTLMTAASNHNAAEFRQWFLREHAPKVMRHCPGLRRYILNLREPAPSIEYMPRLASGGGHRHPYQVVTEMWFDSSHDFTDRDRLYDSPANAQTLEQALKPRVGVSFTYRVSENIEKDTHPVIHGERSPGVKMMPLAGWKPGLAEREGRLAWEVHGPLALRTHIGFSRYVRNVVEETVTPEAPDYRGIAELQFLTMDDAVHRFFPSPAAARIIEFDTARWLVIHDGAFYGEYVLK